MSWAVVVVLALVLAVPTVLGIITAAWFVRLLWLELFGAQC